MANESAVVCDKIGVSERASPQLRETLTNRVGASQTASLRTFVKLNSTTAARDLIVSATDYTLLSDSIRSSESLTVSVKSVGFARSSVRVSERLVSKSKETLLDTVASQQSMAFVVSARSIVSLSNQTFMMDKVLKGDTLSKLTNQTKISGGYTHTQLSYIKNTGDSRQRLIAFSRYRTLDRVSSSETIQYKVKVKLKNTTHVYQNIQGSGKSQYSILKDVFYSNQSVRVQNSQSVQKLADGIISRQTLSSPNDLGWLVSIENWAHSFHTLKPVEWADQDRFQVEGSVQRFDGGADKMQAELQLKRFDSSWNDPERSSTGRLLRLDTMWLTDSDAEDVRVVARTQTKESTKRAQSSRVKFGRGLASPYWELAVSGFELIRTATLKVNESSRRK